MPTETAAASTAPPFAKDNLLGVCAEIGNDFGFDPEYLRVPVVIAMLFAAQYVVIGYLVAAAVVWTGRLLYPVGRRRWTLRRAAPVAVVEEEAVVEPEPMRLAA